MIHLSRPTAYLSASLLLLPGSISMAHAEAGWACQPAPNGGWSCVPKAEAPAVPSTAPAPTTPIPTTRAPTTGAPTTSAPTPAAPTATTTAPDTAVPAAQPGAEPPAAAPATAAPAAAPSTPAPTGAVAAQPAKTQANPWDWVPDATGICCRPNGACDGAYVEPPLDWQDADQSPKNMPARAHAARSVWHGDTINMDGGVTVTQGNLKLTADRADLNRATNRINLYGNVVLHQPHLKVTGTNADVVTTNSFGHVADARLLDYKNGIRVTATKLTRRKADVIELDSATYTRCPPDHEDWQIRSNHIRLNRETGRGEAGSTTVRVANVPVFYTPYLNFPIDDRRQSGFLWPSIGSSSSGIDIAVPYYFNLAPNYDATLTPREITDRGTMLEAEARYLNRYSDWVVSGAQLQSDQKTGQDRWFMGLQEKGSLNSYFSTSIDYNRVSDNNYFHDFSIGSLNIKRQVTLNQQAALNMNYENWYAGLQVQQYQIIDDLVAKPYRKAPQFTFGRRSSGENFALDYNLATELTRFDHDNPNSLTQPGGPRDIGNRLYLEPGLSFPMRWTSAYINPELRMRYVGYDLTRSDYSAYTNTHPSTAIPQAILDAGVFFQRDLTFAGSDYQQTLEPRLYYLYSPYKNQLDQPLFDTSPLTFDFQQLFQPRRFVGHDRLEDFNQLATGLTSRIIESDTGRDLGHASIGQIFYFEDRRVNALTTETRDNQASSAVAGQVVLQPSTGLWVNSNILWDQSSNIIEQGNIYAHYEPREGAIYNIGYRYNQPDAAISTLANGLRQADLSMAVPLNRRWRMFARVNYDLDLHTTLEDMFGVEYEDCCWVTRIVYQRALFSEQLNTIGQPQAQRDTTILVEFQLKGLGGLGRKVNTLLQESIWGYRDRY